jgi:hypothetical protein
MALSQDEIDELAAAPKAVTQDGARYEARSADEIIKLDRYAASKAATAARRSPFRSVTLSPPGTQ